LKKKLQELEEKYAQTSQEKAKADEELKTVSYKAFKKKQKIQELKSKLSVAQDEANEATEQY